MKKETEKPTFQGVTHEGIEQKSVIAGVENINVIFHAYTFQGRPVKIRTWINPTVVINKNQVFSYEKNLILDTDSMSTWYHTSYYSGSTNINATSYYRMEAEKDLVSRNILGQYFIGFPAKSGDRNTWSPSLPSYISAYNIRFKGHVDSIKFLHGLDDASASGDRFRPFLGTVFKLALHNYPVELSVDTNKPVYAVYRAGLTDFPPNVGYSDKFVGDRPLLAFSYFAWDLIYTNQEGEGALWRLWETPFTANQSDCMRFAKSLLQCPLQGEPNMIAYGNTRAARAMSNYALPVIFDFHHIEKTKGKLEYATHDNVVGIAAEKAKRPFELDSTKYKELSKTVLKTLGTTYASAPGVLFPIDLAEFNTIKSVLNHFYLSKTVVKAQADSKTVLRDKYYSGLHVFNNEQDTLTVHNITQATDNTQHARVPAHFVFARFYSEAPVRLPIFVYLPGENAPSIYSDFYTHKHKSRNNVIKKVYLNRIEFIRSYFCVELGVPIDAILTFHKNTVLMSIYGVIEGPPSASSTSEITLRYAYPPMVEKERNTLVDLVGKVDFTGENVKSIKKKYDTLWSLRQNLSKDAGKHQAAFDKMFEEEKKSADALPILKGKDGTPLTLIPLDTARVHEDEEFLHPLKLEDDFFSLLAPKENLSDKQHIDVFDTKVDLHKQLPKCIKEEKDSKGRIDSLLVFINLRDLRNFFTVQIDPTFKNTTPKKDCCTRIKGSVMGKGAIIDTFPKEYDINEGSLSFLNDHPYAVMGVAQAIVFYGYRKDTAAVETLKRYVRPALAPASLPLHEVARESIKDDCEKRYVPKLEVRTISYGYPEKVIQLIDKPYPVLRFSLNLQDYFNPPELTESYFIEKERRWSQKDEAAQKAWLKEQGYTDHVIKFDHVVELNTKDRCSFSNSHLTHEAQLNMINRRVTISTATQLSFKNCVLTNTIFVIKNAAEFDLTQATVINCAFIFKTSPNFIKISEAVLNHTNIRCESFSPFDFYATHCVLNDCHIAVESNVLIDLTHSDLISSNIKCRDNTSCSIVLKHAHVLRSRIDAPRTAIVTSADTLEIESQIGLSKGKK